MSLPDAEHLLVVLADNDERVNAGWPAYEAALKQVALDVCAGMIFVNLGKNPLPLHEWLGGLAEQMETLPVARATTCPVVVSTQVTRTLSVPKSTPATIIQAPSPDPY